MVIEKYPKNIRKTVKTTRTVKKKATEIGLFGGKQTFFNLQHTFSTFFCRCFARLQRETSRNAFYGGNVVCVTVHLFFSLSLIFTLVAASISHFLTAAIKF